MRDVACSFAARFRFVAALLACCAGKRFAFPQLRTLSGSNLMHGAQKRKAPIAGSLIKQVVGDEGCSRAASPPASAAALRALRAALENACAFPQLRTLPGSNPSAVGPSKNGPLSRTVVKQMVGDEGCRVRLRRPLPLRRFAPRVLRWKTLRVSSAPHPDGFESLCDEPKKKGPHCWRPYHSSGGR